MPPLSQREEPKARAAAKARPAAALPKTDPDGRCHICAPSLRSSLASYLSYPAEPQVDCHSPASPTGGGLFFSSTNFPQFLRARSRSGHGCAGNSPRISSDLAAGETFIPVPPQTPHECPVPFAPCSGTGISQSPRGAAAATRRGESA